MGPTKANMLTISRSFLAFANNSRLFQYNSEAYRRLTKMPKDYWRFPRTNSKNFGLHFCRYIYMGKKYVLQFTNSNFFLVEKSL